MPQGVRPASPFSAPLLPAAKNTWPQSQATGARRTERMERWAGKARRRVPSSSSRLPPCQTRRRTNGVRALACAPHAVCSWPLPLERRTSTSASRRRCARLRNRRGGGAGANRHPSSVQDSDHQSRGRWQVLHAHVRTEVSARQTTSSWLCRRHARRCAQVDRLMALAPKLTWPAKAYRAERMMQWGTFLKPLVLLEAGDRPDGNATSPPSGGEAGAWSPDAGGGGGGGWGAGGQVGEVRPWGARRGSHLGGWQHQVEAAYCLAPTMSDHAAGHTSAAGLSPCTWVSMGACHAA